MSIDDAFAAIEARDTNGGARPKTSALVRPVQPADDDECYRLNPWRECGSSWRAAGLKQPEGIRTGPHPRKGKGKAA